MTLTGLSQIVDHIQTQSNWQQLHQFRWIVQNWARVVGNSVAQQSRPTGVYRGVLQVAVSSPVWSQALSFERIRILEKLNTLGVHVITSPLTDIRFSTAKWSSPPKKTPSSPPAEILKHHPSYTINHTTSHTDPPTVPPKDAIEAFHRWAGLMQDRAAHLPRCPCCDRPAPAGELTRWQMCRTCATQRLFN